MSIISQNEIFTSIFANIFHITNFYRASNTIWKNVQFKKNVDLHLILQLLISMSKKYNFDAIIDRSGTGSYKIELMEKYFGTKDALPLWVADMDFATPDFIIEAVENRCKHEIFGYTILQEEWSNPIRKWLKGRYSWDVKTEELTFVPGIVSGIAFCIQCFTQPGDKILIQTPVYPPFFNIPRKNNREVIVNQLVYNEGKFSIDFFDFENKAASGCKVFILCSPHNPGGRVWSRDELTRMLEICRKYDILVVSDEIHADLTLPGFNHTPISTLSDPSRDKLITLMAPSKTFNIPGMCSSFYIVQRNDIRNKLIDFLDQAELSSGNIFSYISAKTAFENGAEWLNQLLDYLQDNINYIDTYIQEYIPSIRVCRPEASFLVWLDCRGLNLESKELQRFILKEAKLALNPGHSFGAGGEGFMRLNVGCPRSVLCHAMQSLRAAYEKL
jgi:cysteine-S-conjugate beta-lyase